MEKLLIIEDDEGIRTQLKWGLAKEYKVLEAGDRLDALKVFNKYKPNVVTMDLGLPPCEDGAEEGLVCLNEILTAEPHTKVIVVSGNDEKENALQAVGRGAYDFYQKPVDLEVLKVILRRAYHLVHLEREYRELSEKISLAGQFEGMIGCCKDMQKVFSGIKKVSSTEATILVTGESGTGKELVASAIHSGSLRKDGPFVPINCGSIPESLIESELFGHEKGAFTDAKSQKIGLVERASGGTLFLDEIGELPLQLQVKMLRFLQERKIQRVGGNREIDVDLRIIAATNVDLEKASKEGKFREDLFFRISVINLTLPPLRNRSDDILILARSFLSRYNKENGRKIKGFSPNGLKALLSYSWPGNVRELENKVQRAVIMADGNMIEPEDLSLSLGEKEVRESLREPHPQGGVASLAPEPLKQARAFAEIEAVRKAMLFHDGNISKAADALQVSRPTLHDLIKKYNLKTKPEEIGQGG